jgi:hypothetical protein
MADLERLATEVVALSTADRDQFDKLVLKKSKLVQDVRRRLLKRQRQWHSLVGTMLFDEVGTPIAQVTHVELSRNDIDASTYARRATVHGVLHVDIRAVGITSDYD